MAHTMTAVTPDPGPRRKPLLVRLAGYFVLISCVLGAAYLAGYLQGKSGLVQLRAQQQSERQAAQTALQQCQGRLELEQQQATLLLARRGLDRAIAALDARNFGIAEAQVKDAHEHLVAAKPHGAIADLAQALGAFRVQVTENLGDQRNQFTRWLEQLDRAIAAPNQ